MSEPLAFATPADWAAWLASHQDATEVWVLYHKKASGTPSIDWQQAVVEAIAWGWIDGIRKTVDDARWMQRFTPRKAGSVWSQINRSHAERLIETGRMQPAGLAQVEIARANGRWEAAYSGGKAAELPQDFLDRVAASSATVRQNFAALGSKERYAIYYRLGTAKRAHTREKRIAEFIALLEQGAAI